MFQRSASILIAMSLAAVPFVAGCQAQPAPAAPAPARAATVWRPLGTWSGRGDGQTGSFTVETGALRFRWETRNERAPGAGRFRVSLHSAISGRPLQVLVERRGTGGDSTYVEDEPRVSYLVIESEDVDWTVNLEEVVPTVSVRSPAP